MEGWRSGAKGEVIGCREMVSISEKAMNITVKDCS